MARLFFVAVFLLLLGSVVYADVGPYGYTRLESFAAVSWLIYLLSATGLFFLIKTGDHNTFASNLFLFGALWAGFGFCMIDFLYGFMFFVVGKLALMLGNAAASVYRARGEIVKNRKQIMAVLLLLVILSQFGLFGFNNKTWETTVTSGWSKLKPLSASTVYKADGSFETTFTNRVESSIKVTYINMTEALSDTACDNIALNGVTYTSGPQNSPVKPRDGFNITAFCPQKNEGDSFDLVITLDYTSVMGGVTTSHRETGRIKGAVEA